MDQERNEDPQVLKLRRDREMLQPILHPVSPSPFGKYYTFQILVISIDSEQQFAQNNSESYFLSYLHNIALIPFRIKELRYVRTQKICDRSMIRVFVKKSWSFPSVKFSLYRLPPGQPSQTYAQVSLCKSHITTCPDISDSQMHYKSHSNLPREPSWNITSKVKKNPDLMYRLKQWKQR